ncbi:hypothetical protein ACXO7D_05345 [Lactobacillus delbrueckii subsp. bulgaricus]
MAQDIEDGNIESLESLIEVKENKPNEECKYSSWLANNLSPLEGDENLQ